MRLIDADKLNRKDINCANVPMNFIDTALTVEAIPKADYEKRLKADMIAILDEIERGGRMSRFSTFTDEELDIMESAFCNEGLKCLVDEIRIERKYRRKHSKIMTAMLKTVVDDLRAGKITMNKAREELNLPPIES